MDSFRAHHEKIPRIAESIPALRFRLLRHVTPHGTAPPMGFPFEHGDFVQRDLGRPGGSWLEFNVVLLLHGLPDPDPDPEPRIL